MDVIKANCGAWMENISIYLKLIATKINKRYFIPSKTSIHTRFNIRFYMYTLYIIWYIVGIKKKKVIGFHLYGRLKIKQFH